MMKKILFLLAVTAVLLSSCTREEPLPDCRLTSFELAELDTIHFHLDTSLDPVRVTNTEWLDPGVDLSALTLVFSLEEEGQLMVNNLEVLSGVTRLDFSQPVFAKTVGPDGMADQYYQIVVNQTAPGAPEIESVEFELNPNNLTPLAGRLSLDLSEACSLELMIKGQDDNNHIRQWAEPADHFEVAVLGLYPDHNNQVTVRITNADGLTNQEKIYIHTDPLPAQFPELHIIENQPDKAEPGFYFLHLERLENGLTGDRQSFICLIDQFGKVRWLYRGAYSAVFTRLENGHWMMGRDNRLHEIDMLGSEVGFNIPVPHLHHDAVELPNGNILALSQYDDSVEDVMLEFDRASGQEIREWDFREILDPERPVNPDHPNPRDWFHNNAVTFDPVDQAFILSGRNQSCLVKIDYETSEIIWILGNHKHWSETFQPFLLTPVGEPFEWQWGQHAPMLSFESNHRLICFDNGSNRSWDDPLEPRENYSRGVEYEIDEDKMEVRQIWQYGKERGHELFSAYISDADYLPLTNNRLICFGGILKSISGEPLRVFNPETGGVASAKNEVRIIEVTATSEVVFELRIASEDANLEGFRSYRAEKISLYPLQIQP